MFELLGLFMVIVIACIFLFQWYGRNLCVMVFLRLPWRLTSLSKYRCSLQTCHIYLYCIYCFMKKTTTQVIIILLLQNCFVWYKEHTHQAISMIKLLKLEIWQLNTKILVVAIVDTLHSGYMKLAEELLRKDIRGIMCCYITLPYSKVLQYILVSEGVRAC